LIGTHKFKTQSPFYIPCKIVAQKDNKSVDYNIFNRIAEATNSQKPIQIRDLKSNSPEMRNLQKMFLKEKNF